MDFKLGQVDQISKDYEKIKLVKNTAFSRIVLENMKSLYDARQRVAKARQLPTSDEFILYDQSIQSLYEVHVYRDDNGEIFMEDGMPRVKDQKLLEDDINALDIEHPVAKQQLLDHQELLKKTLQEEKFTLKSFSELSLPDCLDAQTLELVLRYTS